MVQVSAKCTGLLLDGEEKEWSEEERALKDTVLHNKSLNK